jgi:hypothetical protein
MKERRRFVSLGSPFSCYISDLSRITVSDSLSSAHIGFPLSFDIHHWDLHDYHNQSIPLDVLITGRMKMIFIFWNKIFFFNYYSKLHQVVLFLINGHN